MKTWKGRRLLDGCAVILMLAGMAAGFMATSACKGSARALRSNHYNVRASIDPVHHFIRANVLLRLRVPANGIDRLVFFLHRQLKVNSVTGPDLAGFEVEPKREGQAPFMPEADALVVKLNHSVRKGEVVSLRFRYEGVVTQWPDWSANLISKDWTEIGMYLPWYPCNLDYGDLTYDLSVHSDPAYQLRSYAGYTREGEAWRFRCDRPTADIVLAASRTMHTLETANRDARVWVHYSRINRVTAHDLSSDLGWLLQLYGGWFGGSTTPQITLIESRRTKGGGYARPGLIVLAGLDDVRYRDEREHYVRYLGHESAHLWWHMAPASSWNDWLNESFAEYSALLAIRQRFGAEAFHRRLEEKASKIGGLPPIWGLERTDFSNARTVQAVLYDKGPVLLYTLDKMIGREKFIDLCRAMVARKVTDTQGFLATLEQLDGKGVRQRFEQMLKE